MIIILSNLRFIETEKEQRHHSLYSEIYISMYKPSHSEQIQGPEIHTVTIIHQALS
jgi:hypothetical protein